MKSNTYTTVVNLAVKWVKTYRNSVNVRFHYFYLFFLFFLTKLTKKNKSIRYNDLRLLIFC